MKTTNLLILAILSLTVVVATANTAVGNGIFHKVAQAQQLPQPVLPPGAEVKPQPKVALPSEQTTQYKKVLDECTAAANANIPDVNRLQSCDQKMLFIQGQCDKHQMDQSICDEKKLQDYINKQGLIYSPKPQTMPK
jgi:Icc-related predicted phosphoesterase